MNGYWLTASIDHFWTFIFHVSKELSLLSRNNPIQLSHFGLVYCSLSINQAPNYCNNLKNVSCVLPSFMLTLVSTHPSRTQNFPLCLVNRDCIHKCPALLFNPMLPQYSRTRTVSAWPGPHSTESKLFSKFPSWAQASLRDRHLLPVSRPGPFQVRTCHRDINILDKKLLIRSSHKTVGVI